MYEILFRKVNLFLVVLKAVFQFKKIIYEIKIKGLFWNVKMTTLFRFM